MTHNKNSRKANGSAGPHGRPNGHAPASAERDGLSVHPAQAASDDAGGATVASAALTAAAGADRLEYAAAAPSRPNGAAPHASGNTRNRRHGSAAVKEDSTGKTSHREEEVPPGKSPLPTDPAEFVQEIHRKIDLTMVWHSLLLSEDEKVKQRAAERLTDMFYKGAATSGEESQQIVMDIDSAAARRAAEGASK